MSSLYDPHKHLGSAKIKTKTIKIPSLRTFNVTECQQQYVNQNDYLKKKRLLKKIPKVKEKLHLEPAGVEKRAEMKTNSWVPFKRDRNKQNNPYHGYLFLQYHKYANNLQLFVNSPQKQLYGEEIDHIRSPSSCTLIAVRVM